MQHGSDFINGTTIKKCCCVQAFNLIYTLCVIVLKAESWAQSGCVRKSTTSIQSEVSGAILPCTADNTVTPLTPFHSVMIANTCWDTQPGWAHFGYVEYPWIELGQTSIAF